MKRKLRHLIASVFLLVPLGFLSQPVHAVPVDYELAILLDGSGSIDASDFTTQINGYVNVLNDLYTHHNLWGQNAISVWQFSSGFQMETAAIKIDTATDLATLTGIIAGITQLNGTTNIGGTIEAAANDLLTNSFVANKMVIDVSTDGQHNTGLDPYVTAPAAISAGIDQVNCLGIGTFGGTSYDCGFHSGVGSFEVSAEDFTQFETVLHDKLHRELDIPEPATLMLMGFGLLGLGSMRRRANKMAA